MATVGIDIGTGSVRVCYTDEQGNLFETLEEPITTHNVANDLICQSSDEILAKITDLLRKLKNKDYVAISTAATCSMYVKELIGKKTIGSVTDFSSRKFSLIPTTGQQSNSESNNYDILLWMDNKATKETNELNKTLPKKILDRVGGKLVPELGIPKLRYLQSRFPNKKFLVYELYDYINLSLKEMQNSYNSRLYDDQSYALDGSIKGWSTSTLQNIFHVDNIEIGGFHQSNFEGAVVDGGRSLLPMGYPINLMGLAMKRKVGIDVEKEVIIANGCIDCYAGWLSTIVDPINFNRGILTMVAGTSTCFLYPNFVQEVFVPGIWGPFKISDDIRMYEFGQPATGKLFERLWSQYETVLKKTSKAKDLNEMFNYLDNKISWFESNYNKSIHQMTKQYFYYGDVDGNRSPLNDFEMSEMIVDGKNSHTDCDHMNSISIISEETTDVRQIMSLIIKYVLTLEFLCFQTKQMIEKFNIDGIKKIDKLIMVGSQSKNHRFVQLLSDIIDLPVLTFDKDDSKYNVVRGASLMAKVAYGLLQRKDYTSEGYATVLRKVLPEPDNTEFLEAIPSLQDKKLFKAKYDIFTDMCKSQTKYRDMMQSV